MPSVPTSMPTVPVGDTPYYTPPRLSTIYDVKRVGTGSYMRQVLDFSQPVNMTISGLNADAQYRVYCYSEDQLLQGMDFVTLTNTFVDTSTACCKGLSWVDSGIVSVGTDNGILGSLVVGGVSGSTLTMSFAFNAPPSYDQYFTIYVVPSANPLCQVVNDPKGANTLLPKIVPTLFNISTYSNDLTRHFTVSRGVPGCFQIEIIEAHLVEVPVSTGNVRVFNKTSKSYYDESTGTVYVLQVLGYPTKAPTLAPTAKPVGRKTFYPTGQPTTKPSFLPGTVYARRFKSYLPTVVPTLAPTKPTQQPTEVPTMMPTLAPTRRYQKPYQLTRVLSILPLGSPYPAPVLLQAVFSPDGLKLLVTFDVPTDRGRSVIKGFASQFDCGALLIFPAASRLGCQWTSDDTVSVAVSSYGPAVTSGDPMYVGVGCDMCSVGIKTGVVRAACVDSYACGSMNIYPYSKDANTVSMSLSPSPVTPVAALSAIPLIGACDRLTLDPLGSSGSAGRSWDNIAWSLSSFDLQDAEPLFFAYTSYMNENFNGTQKIWEVPRSLTMYLVTYPNGTSVLGNYTLPYFVSLQFSLLVRSFQQVESVSTAKIMLTSRSLLPSTRIIGANALLISRDSPVTLAAEVTVPPWCGAQSGTLTGTLITGLLTFVLSPGESTGGIAVGSAVTASLPGFIAPGTRVSRLSSTTVYLSAAAERSDSAITLTFTIPTKTSMQYSYRWSVYQGYQFLPTFPSESLDPRVFSISSYKLDTGTRYAIAVVSTITLLSSNGIILDSAQAGAQVVVDVVPAGVMAVIAGGDRLSFNPSWSQRGAAYVPLLIDGSGSFDRDYPQYAQPAVGSVLSGSTSKVYKGLTYIWSCLRIAPVFGSACPFTITNQSQPQVLVDPALPVPGEVYAFQLIVSNAAGLRANASTQVTIVDPAIPVPLVAFTPPLAKYNPSDRIIIDAYLSSGTKTSTGTGTAAVGAGTAAYSWSFSAGGTSIDLSSNSLSPIQSTVSVGPTPTVVEIAVAPGSLTAGKKYRFSLTAGYEGTPGGGFSSVRENAKVLGAVDVIINAPPVGGIFLTSPNSGTALETPFLLSAFSWLDDPADYPLRYVMSYFATSPETDGVLLKAVSTASSVTAYLSAGVVSGGATDLADNMVRCVCKVLDSYGAAAKATSDVTVLASSNSTAASTAAALAQLSLAFISADISAARQLVSGLVQLSNAAMCSTPTGDYSPDPENQRSCASRMRLPCTTVASTCGPCKAGYIGTPGSANSKCTSISSALALQGIGASVTSSAQCLSGQIENSKCVDKPKVCPSGCASYRLDANGVTVRTSYNGACRFFSRFPMPQFPSAATLLLSYRAPQYVPNALRLTTCGETNSTCSAMCVCKPGWFGAACGYNNVTLVAERSKRALMCSAMKSLFKLEDPSDDALLARALNVQSILQDVSLLTLPSILQCAQVIIDTISDYPTAVSGDVPFSATSSTLAHILQLDSLLPDDFKQSVLDALQALAVARQGRLAVGETGSSVATPSMRLLSARVSTGATNIYTGASLAVPLTPFESAAGLAATKVIFEGGQQAMQRRRLSAALSGDDEFNAQQEGKSRRAPALPLEALDTSTERLVPAERAPRQLSAASAVGIVGISLLQYVNNPRNVLTNSTALRVQVVYYGSVASLPQTLSDTYVTITLQNHYPMSYSSREIAVVSVDCPSKKLPFTIDIVCTEFDITFPAQCPGLWKFGTTYVSCPSKKEVPRCALWDSAQGAYVINKACVMLGHTATTTTCQCPLGSLPHTQRVLTAPASNSDGEGRDMDARQTKQGDGGQQNADPDAAPRWKHSIVSSGGLVLERAFGDFLPASFRDGLVGAWSSVLGASTSYPGSSDSGSEAAWDGPVETPNEALSHNRALEGYLEAYARIDPSIEVDADLRGLAAAVRITEGTEVENKPPEAGRRLSEDNEGDQDLDRQNQDEEMNRQDHADRRAWRRLEALRAAKASEPRHYTGTSPDGHKAGSSAFGVPRELAASAVAVATFEFTSNFNIEGTNFDERFIEDGTLLVEEVERNAVIFTTCAGLLAAAFVGIFVFTNWDYRQTFVHNPKYQKEGSENYKLPILRTFESFYGKLLPKEFEDRPWFVRVYNKFLTDHDWLVLVMPSYSADRDFRIAKWIIVVGKVMNFMVADILLGLAFYSDDGTCQSYTAQPTCEATMAIDTLTPVCQWIYERRSCRFRPVVKKFAMTIVITMLISIFASVFDKLLRFLVAQCRRYAEREPSVLGPGRLLTVDNELGDELKDIQKKTTTILRAAKLLWMKENMDFVPPEEELRIMVQHSTRDSWFPADYRPSATNNYLRAIQRDIKTNLLEYYEVADPRSASQLLHHALSNSRQLIHRKLQRARMRAEAIKLALSNIRLNSDKDTYLIRRFLCDSLPGYRRLVAQHYFFHAIETEEFYSKQPLYVLKICLACLVLYFIAMATFIFVWGVLIGSRATDLWLLAVLTALVQDMFLLQPLRIIVKFVFITNAVTAELQALYEVLAIRSKSILTRSTGLFRNKNALVQHFNPACRAARSVPALPAARLLLSLTDYDLPVSHKIKPLVPPRTYVKPLVVGVSQRDLVWYSWQRVVRSPLWSDLYEVTVVNAWYTLRFAYDEITRISFLLMAAFLVVLMNLPDPVQTLILEALLTVISNLWLLAFFFSQAKLGALVCVVVVLVVISAGACLVYKFYILEPGKRREERKKRLAYNEAVRERRAFKRFIEAGEFSVDNMRKKSIYFKERDPNAEKLARDIALKKKDEKLEVQRLARLELGLDPDDDVNDYADSFPGSYNNGEEEEESKMPPRSKPHARPAVETSDRPFSGFGSFPFSSSSSGFASGFFKRAAVVPTESADFPDGPAKGQTAVDVHSAPASPTGKGDTHFFAEGAEGAAGGAAAEEPPSPFNLLDLARKQLQPLRELPGFADVPEQFRASLTKGVANIYQWARRAGGDLAPSSMPTPGAVVLPTNLNSSKFKMVRGPPLPAKKDKKTKRNLITSGLTLTGDDRAQRTTNPYVEQLSGIPDRGGIGLFASRASSPESNRVQEREYDDDSLASSLGSVSTSKYRREEIVKADPSRRVKKHGKHRQPFKAKLQADEDDDEGEVMSDPFGRPHSPTASVATTAASRASPSSKAGSAGGASKLRDDGSTDTSSLQKNVRRVLRAHIGPGHVALDEIAEERHHIKRMGNDTATNQLLLPAKSIHGDLPGLSVLQPEMFGDGLVMPNMPIPTASPTVKSVSRALHADGAHALKASSHHAMSTSGLKQTSPEEQRQSRILAEGSIGSLSAVTTDYDSPIAATKLGRTGTHAIAGGFVGAGLVTDKGRTTEYSSLRNTKRRVIRSYEAQQADPRTDPRDLEIHKDQDSESIAALVQKQAERDVQKRAMPVHRMAFQSGVGFMSPASPPRPIRPVPPPLVVSGAPASFVDKEKDEPPKFPLFY